MREAEAAAEVLPGFDIRRVLALLPHRYPMLLVDRVVDYVPNRTIHAIKAVSMNEPFFQGHFPGRPIMPGVLMIEGAAQIATFLVKQKSDWARDKMIGLAGLDDVRIRGQVGPSSRVYFVAGDLQLSGRRLAKMHAQVFCNGQMTLETHVMGVML